MIEHSISLSASVCQDSIAVAIHASFEGSCNTHWDFILSEMDEHRVSK
jgi:hypothetical protein